MPLWKTSALFAVVGLCSMGSAFAQDTPLPSAPEPTPVTVRSPDYTPSENTFLPMSVPAATGALTPVDPSPMPDMPGDGMIGAAPCSSCGVEASCGQCAAPCHSGCGGVVRMAAPVSSCGCQGGFDPSGGTGFAPAYSMGSGSGVSSGLLSPNASSGGLHTRYPYYNYRHPWYYQGPPSQNVTIIW